MLKAFDTPWTQHARQRQIPPSQHHHRHRHSPCSCCITPSRRHFSAAALSTEHNNSITTRQQDLAIANESISVLNFSDYVTLVDLERAISLRKAESAWSLFQTLSHHKYIPLPLCSSLYSVLAYAKALAGGDQVTGYRQRQIDSLVQYVEETFEIPRTQFMTDAQVIPVPPHKLLQRAIKRRNMRIAWSIYLDLDDLDSVPRNMIFRLMSLVQQQRNLGSAEKQSRLQTIADQHAGVMDNGRALTAEELLQIGKVYYHWDTRDYRTAKGLMMMQSPHTNLMDAMRKRGQYHEALEVFESMLKAGIRPSVNGFNTVIHIYAVQGMSDKAEDMARAMRDLDVSPDAATFAHLLLAYREAGDNRSLMDQYYIMQEQGVQPNAYHYSILLEAFAKRHDAKSVLRWVKSMLKREIPITEIHVTSILKAFRSRHKRHFNNLIINVADHAAAAGIRVNATLYTILLMVQADLSGLDGALQVHRDMLKRCIEPNVITYTVLLHLCGIYHAPEMAVRIFNLMKQSDKHLPDTVTYIAMMDVWLRAHQEDKARDLLQEFLKERKKDTQGRLWIDNKLREYITAFQA
ncbi:hypothetical protein K492DRAFT_127990 [Lichtheimia hyalospora FSU 10163]|nr:hypothetical protein K492DRAFT_127990 [Lichtheimia hyalospora FSU 10163]